MKSKIKTMIEKYSNNRKGIGNVKWDIKRELGSNVVDDISKLKGRNFMEKLFKYVEGISNSPKCKYCNDSDRRFINVFDGYDDACSKKCKNLLLYGVDNPAKAESVKNKVKATNIKRYGGVTPLYSEEVLRKIKNTSIVKYGVEHYSKTGLHLDSYAKKTGFKSPLSNPNTRDKIARTNIKKYGGTTPMASADVRSKVSNSRRGKSYKCGRGQQESFYKRMVEIFEEDIKFEFSMEDYSGTHISTEYKRYPFTCKRCNELFEDFFDHSSIGCPICDKKSQSKPQDAIVEWLVGLGINCDVNNRKIINPLEIDIYLPDYNIGIEFNGLYWHGELNGNKSRHYHSMKTNACTNVGVRLIHIFEDEWNCKQSIVKSRILNALGKCSNRIYARKCDIREVSSKDKIKFLNDTHIQGNCKSSYNLGAYYNDELVSVMTFGKRRFDGVDGFELLRFSNKLNTSVIGIASKLLKHAERNYIDKPLISYCDLRWGTGLVYATIGFNQIRNSPPNYFYVHKGVRLHRQMFQKHKLKDKLNIFDPKLSEWDNMKINGYDRIWDCGNIVFEKVYN